MIEQVKLLDHAPSDGHGGSQWDGTVKIECYDSGRVVFGTLVQVRAPERDRGEVVLHVVCDGCGKEHRFIMPLAGCSEEWGRTNSKSPEDIADHLIRNHPLVIEVLRVVTSEGRFRGKGNLGQIVGARGRNGQFITRPVESATDLGLIGYEIEGNTNVYSMTELGDEVLEVIERR